MKSIQTKFDEVETALHNINNATVAQLVEHIVGNGKVESSILSCGFKPKTKCNKKILI